MSPVLVWEGSADDEMPDFPQIRGYIAEWPD